MNKFIRKIRRYFFTVPNRELSWTYKDFELAKSYAKVLDNPENPKNSLWSKINIPWNDSVDILNEVNKVIRQSLPK